MDNKETNNKSTTAFLLELESQRKIPVLVPTCKLGRDDENDVVMKDDMSISRFHTVISHEDGKYVVTDNESRHGTFLNGNEVTEPMPIGDGDTLKIGNTMFWFVIETEH